MRQKRRYVAFELAGPGFGRSEIVRALRTSSPEAPPKLVLYDENSKKGLLRCALAELEHLKKSLPKIDRIGGENVSFNIIGVSGTIKAARRKFLS